MRLIDNSIVTALGQKVKLHHVEKVVKEQSILMMRRLRSAHYDVLDRGDFTKSDEATLELLFSLCILEYNGDSNTREINPLISDEFKNKK